MRNTNIAPPSKVNLNNSINFVLEKKRLDAGEPSKVCFLGWVLRVRSAGAGSRGKKHRANSWCYRLGTDQYSFGIRNT